MFDYNKMIQRAVQFFPTWSDIRKRYKTSTGGKLIGSTLEEICELEDAIKEYTVERFEENIVVLEDRKTQKMLNIEKNKLPNKIKEGDIIKEINGKFLKEEEKTEEVLERIKNKMDDLWN